MAPSVTIAYAYGASGWTYVQEQEAFEQHLGLEFTFEGLDWRPKLPAAAPYLLRFLHDRMPERSCQTRASEQVLGIDEADFPSAEERAADQAELDHLQGTAAEINIQGFPFDRQVMRAVYHKVTGDSGLTIADAMRYVARPDAPTKLVADRLVAIKAKEPDRPIVAVGLSLGGLILVNALRSLKAKGQQPATLLITIGSQSAALRALGVLPGAGPDVDQPDLFTPWLNIWHEHDYLSFPVGAIFQHLEDVCDRRANQGGAFPWVHSRYLTTESGAFDFIREEIRRRIPS